MSQASYINELIEQQCLPRSYANIVEDYLFELAAKIQRSIEFHRSYKNTPMVLGIQGSQGSGKSTCALFLKEILAKEYKTQSVILSIDDFYKTKQSRQDMANDVHPLFVTRGVPGTHDVELALATFEALLNQASSQEQVLIPRFNKASDDRYPQADWDVVSNSPDLIIFEGWCVGTTPQPEAQLSQAINELEANEDGSQVWRQYVNESLENEYQTLFGYLDRLIVLQAPSFDCVYNWRKLQEDKLRERAKADGTTSDGVMNAVQVKRFIDHYQRLTEHNLSVLPKIADWVVELNQAHGFDRISGAAETNSNSIISTDLDGTLLDHHSYSWAAAKPALRAIRASGASLVLNTSKTFDEALDLQKELGLDSPLIVENGSLLYLPVNKSIFDVDAAQIVGDDNVPADNGFYRVSFGIGRADILAIAHGLRTEHGYAYTGFSDWAVAQIAESTGLNYEQAKRASRKQCSEPFIWEDTETRLEEFVSQLNKQGVKVLKGGRYFHLQGDCDKATPLIWLRNKLNAIKYGVADDVGALKLICLGDNHNDVAMLEVADTAICVKSPVNDYPEIKNNNTLYTHLEGPRGWNAQILELLSGSK